MAPNVIEKEQISLEHHFELPQCPEYYFCTPLKYTLSEEEEESPLSDYIFTGKTYYLCSKHSTKERVVFLLTFSLHVA